MRRRYAGEGRKVWNIFRLFQLSNMQKYKADLDGHQMSKVQRGRTHRTKDEKRKTNFLRVFKISEL